MDFLMRGLVLGFAIAAPVGPIGILCIHRTLEKGRINGFVSGLGAATTDASYGAIAAFGLTTISGFLLGYAIPIRIVGGLFIAYLAIKIFMAKPARDQQVPEANMLLFKAYASTVFLTLTNPSTIISFLAVFAGFGLANATGFASASLLVAGVFLGSAVWWLILSQSVGLLRHRFSVAHMAWVNRLSGALMMILAVVSLAGAFVI